MSLLGLLEIDMDCGLRGKDRAEWLADNIPAYGDYAKEAALVLVQQENEIDRLRTELERISLNVYGDLPAQVIAGEALRPNA